MHKVYLVKNNKKNNDNAAATLLLSVAVEKNSCEIKEKDLLLCIFGSDKWEDTQHPPLDFLFFYNN